MCGICGFNWNDDELVTRMAETIAHRGPDQHGHFCAEGISLGHRRLSIIDLSEQGRQPMANEDGAIRMVFNGEIYNFRELRDELLAKGHKFASHTDSEVIIHAYEEYGPEALQKLRGMFAFAIWDGRNKRLFAARDRIGIKPFYYYHGDGRFLFASEIKAILEDKAVPRQLHHQALYDYLGFEFVAAPDTMFRDIRKLPAGHYLVLDGRNLEVKRYWDLSFIGREAPPSYEEAVERERQLLDEAVRSHLVSDVPLGVFLSGGLDSSTIVALMRRHISGTLRTFTIGYEDRTFSELEYAEQVAKKFETEHHVLQIDSLKPEYVEKTLWHLDEPMTDLSSIPLYLVCRKAKEYATVCLSGEGGDEIFAGYDRFKASRLDRALASCTSAAFRRDVLYPFARRLQDRPQKKGAVNMLKRFLEGSSLPPEGRHLRWQYFSNAEQDSSLFSQAFREQVKFDPFRRVREHEMLCDASDTVNREIYLDTRFMMADSVLMKVDKMSMASALEIRVPFLDHKVVEFNATLPGDWKLKRLQTKHILRSALQGLLPDNIIYRGKQGYSLPVKHMLRGDLRKYMIKLLNDSPIVKANTNVDFVNRLIREHLDMKHNHNHVLWGLINVAIWQEKFKVVS